MSYNKITLIGNLGRDPEMRSMPDGTPVCSFSLATNERRKDGNGEPKDETTWFSVSFFGQKAEIAGKYLSKGRQVFIEGRLRAREWTDKEGKAYTTLEVSGTELQMTDRKDDEEAVAAGKTKK